MEIIQGILEGIGKFFGNIVEGATAVFTATDSVELIYTAIVRWVFIFLAVFILSKAILSLLKSKNPSEVWAYLHIGDYENIPITHWENVIGRAKSCDIQVDDLSVSRNHGTLTRDNDGVWSYMDLGSKNGAVINGVQARPYIPVEVRAGDDIVMGASVCTLFPVSIEEHNNNVLLRTEDTKLLSPWPSLLAITLFQILTVIQLKFALGDKFYFSSLLAFAGLCAVMWVYVIFLRTMKRKGFEIETIAFFLSTLSLAVTATCLPDQVFKQFIAVAIGVVLFFFMCTFLRNLERTIEIKKYIYIAAALLLLVNLVLGRLGGAINGSYNWIQFAGMSIQPSEIVKLAFIWVGAASLDELFRKKNSLVFTLFSGFCFACLALMGDFGTAIIFFVTFLVISFLRSGDFTKLILILGVAFVGGLMVLRFKAYVAARFAVWGHVWQYADAGGYQQTRTMTAAASGGFVGLGAGEGWLRFIPASQTDLVFGVLTEEWGLIIAIMAVLAIITLSIFAFRSIWAGRSTYYTIAACSAMSIFLFQTVLNVFGSVDLLPLTGVTFPFVSSGGTAMIASWGLLAFLKAADTRQNASIAVSLSDRGLTSEGSDEI